MTVPTTTVEQAKPSPLQLADVIWILAELNVVETRNFSKCRLLQWSLPGATPHVNIITEPSEMAVAALIMHDPRLKIAVTTRGNTEIFFGSRENVEAKLIPLVGDDTVLAQDMISILVTAEDKDKLQLGNLWIRATKEFMVNFFGLPGLPQPVVDAIIKGTVSTLMSLSSLKMASLLFTFLERDASGSSGMLKAGGGLCLSRDANTVEAIHVFHAGVVEGHHRQMQDLLPQSTIVDAKGRPTQLILPKG